MRRRTARQREIEAACAMWESPISDAVGHKQLINIVMRNGVRHQGSGLACSISFAYQRGLLMLRPNRRFSSAELLFLDITQISSMTLEKSA
jgi:hypothetical protein